MSADYAVDLRRALAREQLAMALYDAKRLVHCPTMPEWTTLRDPLKDGWRLDADQKIADLEPMRTGPAPIFLTGLRPHCGSVIGKIEPRSI